MTYLDETLQALDDGNVYVSATVQATSTNPVDEAKLEKALGDSDIAVVILPDTALSEIDSIPSFINQIAANTNFHTILVAVGDDMDAKSSMLDKPGLASALANQAEQQHPGDLTAATEEFIAAVETHAPMNDAPGDSSIGIAGIGGIVIGVAVLLAGGAVGWKAYRKRTKLAGVERHIAAIRRLADSVEDRTTKKNLQAVSYELDKLVRLALRIDDAEQRDTSIDTVKVRYDLALRQLVSITTRLVKVQDNYGSGRLDLSELNKSIETCMVATRSDYEAIANKSFDDFAAESTSFQMLFPPNILNG